MLNNVPVVTTMPAVDLRRAERFYRETLGLKRIEIPGEDEEIVFEAGYGTRLGLYQRGPTKADHTVATFQVSNIDAVVDWLTGRGVVFEQYDFPGLQTDARGIATMGTVKTAWFRDTEGNILAINQDPKAWITT